MVAGIVGQSIRTPCPAGYAPDGRSMTGSSHCWTHTRLTSSKIAGSGVTAALSLRYRRPVTASTGAVAVSDIWVHTLPIRPQSSPDVATESTTAPFPSRKSTRISTDDGVRPDTTHTPVWNTLRGSTANGAYIWLTALPLVKVLVSWTARVPSCADAIVSVHVPATTVRPGV